MKPGPTSPFFVARMVIAVLTIIHSFRSSATFRGTVNLPFFPFHGSRALKESWGKASKTRFCPFVVVLGPPSALLWFHRSTFFFAKKAVFTPA
jgi:hypothetical protein